MRNAARKMPINLYRYRITEVKPRSGGLGACEVCNKEVEQLFYQVEEKLYRRLDGQPGWTQHRCRSLFGHRDCLEAQQRDRATETLELLRQSTRFAEQRIAAS